MFKSLVLIGLISSTSLSIPIDIDSLFNSTAKLRETNCDSAYTILAGMDESTTELNIGQQAERSLQMALSQYCLGNYDLSLTLYQQAVSLFDSAQMSGKSVLTLNLIGTLHKKQGDFENALNYYQSGLKLARGVNDLIEIGNSLNNIGLVHFQQGDINVAKDYFLKSNIYKSEAKDTLGLSYNYDNLGQVYAQLSMPDSSIYYFKIAARYKEIAGEHIGGAIVQNNIGEALLMNGAPLDAEPYFLKALTVAQEVGFADFEKHILLKLSEVYEQTDQIGKSLHYYKQHVALSDSLFNISKSKAIAELETKYQTEKKEQQLAIQAAKIAGHTAENQRNLSIIIGLLFAVGLLVVVVLLGRSRSRKKHALILKQAEVLLKEAQIQAAISSQEKERSRFAKDLHDGFGQMISILNLNLKSLEDGGKDKHEVFESSTQVLKVMYQELKGICFNLMPQTLIKHGAPAALDEFAARINQTDKIRVETDFFGMEERLTDVQEISLYRIGQEWVNNVIKYSDADKITIQITRDEGEITLLIEDNGSGFDPVLLTQGKGNGWKNMNSRANLINGVLELDTTPGLKGNTLIVNVVIEPVTAIV